MIILSLQESDLLFSKISVKLLMIIKSIYLVMFPNPCSWNSFFLCAQYKDFCDMSQYKLNLDPRFKKKNPPLLDFWKFSEWKLALNVVKIFRAILILKYFGVKMNVLYLYSCTYPESVFFSLVIHSLKHLLSNHYWPGTERLWI